MIKKISLTILLCCIIISCGKKGDPEYKASGNKEKTQRILVKKS